MDVLDNLEPTSITQLYLAPYIEFSRRYGSKDRTLLDCDCGTLYQKELLEDRFGEVFYVGKDSRSGIENYLQLDVEKKRLPFKTRRFDITFSFNTIEKMNESKQVDFVKDLLRVSKNVLIGSVSTDGPNYLGKDIVAKKSTGTSDVNKNEFSSTQFKEFFNNMEEELVGSFYRLDHTWAGFEIVDDLNGITGFHNYILLTTSRS